MAAASDEGWEVLHLRFDGSVSDLNNDPLPASCRSGAWLGSEKPFTEAKRDDFITDFRRVVSSFGPTVIHAGPVPTVGSIAVAADLAPVLVMSWASDLLVETSNSEMAEQRAREALEGAAGVLVDCATVADRAAELGARKEDTLVVPWGVDLNEFPVAEDWPDFEGPLRLVCLRSHEPIYDVGTIIDAASIAIHDLGVELEVGLAGSGSLHEELKKRSQTRGISRYVAWHGRVPEREIHSLLVGAHLHVSTALIDGTSISLLQAMATGRPSIVADIPSNREWIIDSLNGWLSPPGDSHSLAAKLLTISKHRTQLPELARRGRNSVEERADWETNRLRFSDLLLRLQRGEEARNIY